jgi:hypothetical protein
VFGEAERGGHADPRRDGDGSDALLRRRDEELTAGRMGIDAEPSLAHLQPLGAEKRCALAEQQVVELL